MQNRRAMMARVAAVSLVALSGWARADPPARETRTISQPFHEVRLMGSIDLDLTQSDNVSLVIEAPRDDLPRVRVEVHDGVLTFKQDRQGSLNIFGWFSKHPSPRAFLSTKAIDRLVVDGSGDIHVGAWTSPADLEVRVAGASNVKFDHLEAARFACSISGSADIRLAGSATTQDIRISGSGDYRAPDLRSQTTSVAISGSGNVEIWAQRALDVRIAGSGTVGYYGAPTLTRSVAGSGSLTSLGAKAAP
jgi:hypothetical protein